MSFRHRKYKCFTWTLFISLICLPHRVLSLAPVPVDFLVPPPLPQANVAATRFKQASPQNLLPSESRTIPKFINPQLAAVPNDKQPGLITRVARWFGFAKQNAVTDQQLAADTNKNPYYYQTPQQQQQHGAGDKELCYLCNKYPWMPMMQNSLQYPQTGNKWDASKPLYAQNYPNAFNAIGGQQPQVFQNTYGITASQSVPQIQHAASSVKQRAVKFNFPLPYAPASANNLHDVANQVQYSTGPFLPIPVPPHLSNSALPPLFSAQNFVSPIAPIPHTIQDLPSTEPAHFAENIAEHSEIHIDTAILTQVPPTTAIKDASFEIVKSHQLVDYVSSVEYPASYVPSHSYDVVTQIPVLPVIHQHTKPNINAGVYQHSTFSPNLSQHVPASQILTEPGSFVTTNQQQPFSQQNAIEDTTVYSNQPQDMASVQHYADDNYVAASYRNSSIVDSQQEQLQHHTASDAWSLESNDHIYATSSPETISTSENPSTFTNEWESTTQPQLQDNEIEFIASVQTQHSNKDANKLWPQKPKGRETPKRLLDSPIQHSNGNLGVPRPFTRDPSDLTFRLSPPNHKLTETDQVILPHETGENKTTSTVSPISSSTYSSIDASGQYAGMSPPSLPSYYNANQVLLPYLTIKNRPRPFESTKINMITRSPSTTVYSTWSQAPNLELHTPQESMLVKSHIKLAATTTTTTAKPRTTKYLTKILASNLRELLQREHEPTKLKLRPNSLDIDINKLQKNIDDWTEQEYTSLSHRPSTPTIRGRSKHIPSEYLPATTTALKTARQSKTTKSFTDNSELPSSINNLEPLYERGSTKHYQYTPITDNHLRNYYNNFEIQKSTSSTNYKTTTTPPSTNYKTTTTPSSTTTTMTSSTTKTTTEKSIYLRPVQLQEPEELWKKAKVSISPKTQEKVYVVTPQPRFFPQRFYTTTTTPSSTTTTTKDLSRVILGSGFKSPRFLVRPTPGNDTQTKESSKENNNNAYFTPDWFGLRGLSAYVPAEPVEIIDGNSKVLNIVTPTSNLEETTHHNIMDLTKDRHTASKRKATMAPSPR